MKKGSIEEFVLRYWKDIKIPAPIFSETKFKRACYSKFAARDILTAIRFDKFNHPIVAIEEYSARMLVYSKRSKSNSYMYMVFYDTAEDILYELKRRNKHEK